MLLHTQTPLPPGCRKHQKETHGAPSLLVVRKKTGKTASSWLRSFLERGDESQRGPSFGDRAQRTQPNCTKEPASRQLRLLSAPPIKCLELHKKDAKHALCPLQQAYGDGGSRVGARGRGSAPAPRSTLVCRLETAPTRPACGVFYTTDECALLLVVVMLLHCCSKEKPIHASGLFGGLD